jgi:thiamine biosynthesis protein ThiI
MPVDSIVFHYGEIALKSGNRLFFEKKLAENLKRILEPIGISGWRMLRGRIVAGLTPKTDIIALRRLMPYLFGVVYASLSSRTEPEYGAIERAAVEFMASAPSGSFKIETVRADKRFPLTSMEMSAKLGAAVIEGSGRPVDVKKPDLVCSVEIIENDAFVSIARLEGPGGLPTGSQSPVLVMLSGGLDSPVAALRLERRGATVVGVHFQSYPITSRASLDKVKDLASVLAIGQGGFDLLSVPFADIQRAVVKSALPGLRVLLYRRSMFRLAEAVARQRGILALATGESLGQVASQTVENIAAVDEAVRLPVLRPLIGTNKEEIMGEAKIYGTYDISIRPHEDCCSLFLPEHPETRARLDRVLAAEAGITGLAESEKAALDAVETIRV